MNMTPAAIVLIVGAIDRSERVTRMVALDDARAAMEPDGKRWNKTMNRLAKRPRNDG